MNVTIWYYNEMSDTKYYNTTLPLVFSNRDKGGKQELFVYGIEIDILVSDIQCINPE